MTTQLKALILGSSKGIGSAALKAALQNGYEAEVISSNDIDTSSEESIELFSNKLKDITFDLILFNSGGLPPVKSEIINGKANNLFNPVKKSINAHTLGYISLLEKIKINKKLLILHVSSHVVCNKEDIMFSSAIARSAMETMIEYLPCMFPEYEITSINLRFGPVLTDRLAKLLERNSEDPKQLMSDLKACAEMPISVKQLEDFFSYLISTGRYIHGTSTLNLDSGINSSLNILPA